MADETDFPVARTGQRITAETQQPGLGRDTAACGIGRVRQISSGHPLRIGAMGKVAA